MAINDFAGPIIQAFMQGKQLKRQTEQDILQAEEQKQRLKQQEAELKRLERQDKLQLELGRMQIEDKLRTQMASGMRKIPTVQDETLVGGVAAPTINPIAGNLMQAGVSEPMQLGSEFAIPETVRRQDPIVRTENFGEFDLSQMTTPEEVLQRQAREAGLKTAIKLNEVAGTEAIKAKGQSALQTQRDEAAMKRTEATIAGQKEVAGKRAETQQSQFEQRMEMQRNQMQQARELALARIAEMRANRAAKLAAKEVVDPVDVARERISLLKDFEAETLTKEDFDMFPQKERIGILRDLRDNGIDLLSKEQKESITAFDTMAKFAQRAEELVKVYEGSLVQGLPLTQAKNLEASLLADLEVFGRGTKEVKGVFSDKDIERIKNALPSGSWRQNRTADNRGRVALIRNQLQRKFEETYKSLSPQKRDELRERAGLGKVGK